VHNTNDNSYVLKVILGVPLLYCFIGALACWRPHYLLFFDYPNLTLGNELGFLMVGAFLGVMAGLLALFVIFTSFTSKNRRKGVWIIALVGAGVIGLIIAVMSFCGSIIAAA
jgi:hypothetical protein